MNLSRLAWAVAPWLIVCSTAGAQAPAGLTPIPLFTAASIQQRCDAALAAARQTVKALERERSAPLAVLPGLNRLSLQIAAFSNPVYLAANVAVDQATRDAAQRCVEKWTPLSTELYQSQALFQRVKAAQPTDLIDQRYRQDLLNSFEDTGASLPPARRARAKAIQDRLGLLDLAYQKAANEDPTTVTLAVADAAGLPEAWLAARQRDTQGRLVLRMDYPTVVPFLQNATNEEARRKVWTAFQRLGGQANIARLDKALKLRRELAALHGQPDYASHALRRQMAGDPKTVLDFLARVRGAVTELEQRELAELRAEKATLLGKPVAEVTVQRWDTAYLQERIKRARYSIDQEKLREYFPTQPSVQFAITLAERLYGIEFVRVPVPAWHPDVQVYEVYDSTAEGRRGAFVGAAYLDLFPREGKYNHAAAFPVTPGSTLAGQKPVSVLVTNFNPKGLDHDELETLLHEFGHVLHGVLSNTRYADQSGTAVKRDFVEAPSQMFEEWARRPQTLAVLAEICPSCPRLDAAQLQQLDAARTFGRGMRYSRQWQYATYDMQLHTATAGKPAQPALPTWVALEKSMPLGYVEGTLFPANFGHLLGGYAAGYYGYMWSEVLALDMLSAFEGRLMDPAVGRRYRELILSRGGEVPPQEMVRAFLGRDPNPEAFFKEITGRR